MRMRIIWGAKVPKSGVMRMRYKGDSGDMRMRMTLSGYGISVELKKTFYYIETLKYLC